MAQRVAMIPVAQIKANPESLRTVDKESTHYLELRESMGALGLQNSIAVVESEFDDPENAGQKITGFTLVDCLQRTSCADDLGWTEIPAIIQDQNQSDQILAQCLANGTNVPTKPAQFARQLRVYMDLNPLLTLTELSTKMGWSRERLTKLLGILKLPEELRKRVDNGKISLTNADKLSSLKDEDLMERFAADASAQTSDEFKETLAAFKKQEKAQRLSGEPVVPVFEAQVILFTRSELLDEVENKTRMVSALEAANASTPEEGYRTALDVVTHMDQNGLAQQKASWDEKQKKAAEQAETRSKKKRENEEKALEKRKDDASAKLAAIRSGTTEG